MFKNNFLQMIAGALLATSIPVLAQNYPAKPVRFVVGFPPGGTNDLIIRAIAQKLTEQMGQQFIVENRGGANTAIASEMFARTAAPDGYTIMLNAPGHATNPAMMKLNFDPMKDFAFITIAAQSVNLLVAHPSASVSSVAELLAAAELLQKEKIAYTGAVLDPYLAPDGRPTDNRGIEFIDPERLAREFAPALDRAGFQPAMAINGRRNKPFGPGGSTRRLHPSPAGTGFGGAEPGSTRV